MREKRFSVDNFHIKDNNKPRGRLYDLTQQGGVNAFCSFVNGLNEKCERLVEENKEQQDTIEGLLLDRNRQEEKLDIAREKLKKQITQLERDKISMNTMIENFEKLEEKNRVLKDYIDSIFEGNTHICKFLDVEDVKFYCLKNEDYEFPFCLYKKCFEEENLVEVNEKINEVCE